MKDLYTKTIAQQGIAAQLATATVTGSAVDLDGANAAVAVFNIGSSLDDITSANLFEVGLTECATSGGSYTAVSSADLIAPAGGLAISGGVAALGYIGSKRYIKPVITLNGTHTSGAYVAAEVVKGDLAIAK